MNIFSIFNKKNTEKIQLCFGSDFPYFYHSIPSDEIQKRVEIQKSLCVIDEKYFFHRGRLEIPILNYNENLLFNIWTTISEENFGKRMDDWNNLERINNEPYFGWLQNEIPTYGNCINIKTIAFENEPDQIPKIKVIEENHPLTFDQENGITLQKAKKIVSKMISK